MRFFVCFLMIIYSNSKVIKRLLLYADVGLHRTFFAGKIMHSLV